jgi:16S rRNA (guanine527-N7)-methyltransferase
VDSREFQRRLALQAKRAALDLPVPLASALEAYYRILATWNQKINLTGLDLAEASPQALDRLLIEPVVAAAYVPAEATRMLDVGSGGGSPAIPMALAAPGLELVMVESRSRKAVFLREAARTVGLRASVLTSRFEALRGDQQFADAFDIVTARAVRVDAQALADLRWFVKPSGRVFLFRTSAVTIEPYGISPAAVHPLLPLSASELALFTKA